jgi:hypothetical protein
MLLQQIFSKFIDDCENHQPMAADSKLVWTLSATMFSFFTDGTTRASKFQEILQDSDIAVSATTIDGSLLTATFSSKFPLCDNRGKNKIGSKGAEPHTQAISYYIHANKSSVTRMPDSQFPCILITLFGKFSAPYH